MYAENELKGIAQAALEHAAKSTVEVILSDQQKALTRYSDNAISQNLAGRKLNLIVRLIQQGRVGRAATGNLSPDGVKRCVETAAAAAEVADPNPDLPPLPGPSSYRAINGFSSLTAELTPAARARAVAAAATGCKRNELSGAGIFSSDAEALCVANSNGLWAYHHSTNAAFSLTAMSADSSGWAQQTDGDVSKVDVDGIADTAVRKALAGRNPVVADPGEWTVIFEPAAVADILLFLGFESLNGLNYVEDRSCFSHKAGAEVMGENITLTDNAYHPLSAGCPFDYIGDPRREVVMIENGIFRSPVHDRGTASRAGAETTGHAMPQPDTGGPVPLSMVMAPGDSSLDEMVASTDKGLLVTRLHYTNILDPMKMTLTGMTRDGLFLIEKGRVGRGVKNMRFTDSALRVMSNVEALSKELHRTTTFWGMGAMVVPVIKVKGFRFTSVTEN